MKHVLWERNEEADFWANIGAEGQRKLAIDRCNKSWNMEGVERLHGKSGCGVVIEMEQMGDN